jgi:TonB family protein
MQRVCGMLAALLLAAPLTAAAVSDAERLALYREFLESFGKRDYAAALPLAENLVVLTEKQYGLEDRALVNPLTNLGTVHYRMGNYPAAELAYLRGVRILDARAAGADRMLLRPLQGLGETYYSAQRYAEAAAALKRAVDISRNVDGLFNIDQLPILETLIDSYVAQDRLQEAEKEHQYAFRVAESNYGRNDLRLLVPLDRYARWFEFLARYTSARALHARALLLAEQLAGRESPLRVDALRGLARTYYLEFIYGPEEAETTMDPFATGSLTAAPPAAGRLNSDGERALRIALDVLTNAKPIDLRRRGSTYTDLGDWYLISGSLARAMETYRAAWQDLAAAGDNALRQLTVPRRLAYRAPSVAVIRARPSNPQDYEERFVEVGFTVTREGKVTDAVATASDAPEAVQKSVLFAVRKARYAPRIENGDAVDTPNVSFSERVLVRKATPTK